ncbi:MAG TPA: hypothetical protein VK174_07405, partial [Chitinophagales bacterium]|nr:hypothetical protein [Chitinophagales bacterium]
MKQLLDTIFNVTDTGFEAVALQVFKYQYYQVDIYRQYCDLLKCNPATVRQMADIPFLPIEFFKTHKVIA